MRPLTMSCPGCNALMDADAIFCNECGLAVPEALSIEGQGPSARPTSAFPQVADVPQAKEVNRASVTKTCPKCSIQVPNTVKFCSRCAHDFSTDHGKQSWSGKCPNCLKLFAPDDQFCRHCATDLRGNAKSSAVFCTKCGTPFSRGDTFCSSCSAEVSKSDHTVAMPIVLDQGPSFGEPNALADKNPELENKRHWLSPSAAAFALICFFMPWAEASCNAFGTTLGSRTISGADLAGFDGSLWLLPILSGAIIAVFFYFRSQNRLLFARPFIVGCSIFAVLFILFKMAALNADMRSVSSGNFGGSGWQTGTDFKLRFGVFGVIAGYVLSLIGCLYLGKFSIQRAKLQPLETLGQSGGVGPRVHAMLCYLVFSLSPFLLPLFVTLLFAVFGNELIAILSFYAVPLALPIYILKSTHFAGNTWLRFHAAQSALMVGLSAGLFFLVVMIDKPGQTSGTGVIFILYLCMTFGFVLFLISVFMAVKAFQRDAVMIPIIGKWALSYVTGSERRAV